MDYILDATGKTESEIRKELERAGISENDIRIILNEIQKMGDE